MAVVDQNQVEWRLVLGELKPFIANQEVVWAAQPGSQVAFLGCPIYEALLEGTRGGGKTDCLLMDFAQHTGRGYGVDWRGVLFRQTYPQLSDVIAKSKKWFPRVFPKAKYNESQAKWIFPDGEELLLRQIEVPDDYWNFHGHAYPWIAFEELTSWADDKCYRVMMSCSRSTRAGMPRKYRATTNPYGPGHNWVKRRFKLPVPHRHIVGPLISEVTPEGDTLPDRIVIHSDLSENKVMLANEPNYKAKIRAAASNPAQLAAWLFGDWTITAGGMFDDIWNPAYHTVPDIRADMIPKGWKIDRSYDHGQSRPFSVGWWAQSNGEPITVGRYKLGNIRGDVYRVAEWYGWNGQDNEGLRMTAIEIARGIIERERMLGLSGRVRPGPADTSVFDDYEPGRSVAGDMARLGIHWLRADKTSGSRKQGWQQMRQYLKDALPQPGSPRERPGLFICQSCDQFLRTVPVLPRDDKDLDDVNTLAEDHVADEARYRLRVHRSEGRARQWV